ncbi:polysaccharide pyruvyl transferase family protein [Allorhizobium terrae]|uniref:Polysaccharide pyruvyl transferase family protein n=1 Tax=Allorhizobium terrae TaxID=1848972 RepID=A0A4S3ZRE1_9HYPH|nr:polysaccharide pyruvyl transferase family protein [Allorhizobium terrae]THF48083.1 polysaccharide pyruvyl transferase family protein [Allorhizobium terrae]
MPLILNIHRSNTSNIGDIKSSPFNFFDVPGWDIVRHDILESVNSNHRAQWEASFDAADCVVIGGGGLFGIDFFEPALNEAYRRRRPDQKFVTWGAGHNNYQVGSWREMKYNLDLIPFNYDLIGLRDANQIYDWVPCPSCMDPAFDEYYEITEDVVFFKHIETDLDEYTLSILPKNIRVIDNYTSFHDVIKYLASAELVLTSSFHGAYWATLLGRRVVAFPFSSKFYSLRHPVALSDIQDWKRMAQQARTYPQALEECRGANIKFHQKFLDYLAP